jgi:hypothetical protein
MIDYALTFPDEATWIALADEQGWVKKGLDNDIFYIYPNISFVVIGKIYPPPPEPVPDPYVPVPYSGFGVNLRFVEGSLPDTMTQYVVEPNPQQYTFAGGWFG